MENKVMNICTNNEVVKEIQQIQSDPDTNYGYRKMSYCLQQMGYIINHKKVYRLMGETVAYLSPMNFWKCWEYGWIKTVVNQIRKTVKFKLRTPYQEVLKYIENHENTESLNDLKTEKFEIIENCYNFA